METTNPLAKLLGSSPFKPLQAQMHLVNECVSEVPAMFDALLSNDNEALMTRAKNIAEKEGEANKLKHEMRAHMPKSLFMPVDRRDLLEMLEMQDTMADTSKHIAGLLTERSMQVPEGMNDSLIEFVKACAGTCHQTTAIIEELDELIEAGFRGREADKVEIMVIKLNNLEQSTDEMAYALKQQLFAMEEKLDPVSVMMWYQLIQWIAEIADFAEDVGERMSLMVAR